jgi:hypothetical protein
MLITNNTDFDAINKVKELNRKILAYNIEKKLSAE